MKKKAKPSTQPSLFPAGELFPFSELDAAREGALKCTKCSLHETRNKVVFGNGKVDRPDLMFIGEAPGANEDKEGLPFIGPAGKLLNRMLEAIGYKREDVYICNVVCCRPPNNRVPALQEVAQCAEYLVRQIRVVAPSVIVLLGKTAAESVLGRTFQTLDGARKNWYTWDTTPVRVTYHPAYLLRNGAKKKDALEDLKTVRQKVQQLKIKA